MKKNILIALLAIFITSVSAKEASVTNSSTSTFELVKADVSRDKLLSTKRHPWSCSRSCNVLVGNCEKYPNPYGFQCTEDWWDCYGECLLD